MVFPSVRIRYLDFVETLQNVKVYLRCASDNPLIWMFNGNPIFFHSIRNLTNTGPIFSWAVNNSHSTDMEKENIDYDLSTTMVLNGYITFYVKIGSLL